VGKPLSKNLNYDDSDEDKHGDNELISLDSESRDRSSTAAEKVPKLKKPD